MGRILHLKNMNHLGDSIFNMIFFHTIKEELDKQDIIIHYYCNPKYIRQVTEFLPCNRIRVFNVLKYPLASFSFIELFFTSPYFGKLINVKKEEGRMSFDDIYKVFFNVVLQKLNIRKVFQKLEYEDPSLLVRYKRLPDIYKDVDILIINSEPLSNQYVYNENEWSQYISFLNTRYNVVTTKKVPGVKCTMDHNFTLKTIAAISTHAKVVIAINTGVFPGFLNTYTLNNVRKFYIFDKKKFYSYPKFERRNSQITSIKTEELDTYIFQPKIEE